MKLGLIEVLRQWSEQRRVKFRGSLVHQLQAVVMPLSYILYGIWVIISGDFGVHMPRVFEFEYNMKQMLVNGGRTGIKIGKSHNGGVFV